LRLNSQEKYILEGSHTHIF